MIDVSFLECTGCGACASVCPTGCITMTQNNKGYYVPVVDKEKCVNCGLCEKSCHILANHADKRDNDTYYAGWTKNVQGRHKGSSGGVFGELANYVMQRGGVVFGAAFSEDYKSLAHCSTDNVDLERLKKSKYFESDMGLCIKEIKNELKKDRWVLFCGTPCQAMGVRAALGQKYDKLIIVDFLCHGVPSQKAYEKYICDIEKKYNSRVTSVSFRSKKLGWKTYCMYITFENGKEYLKLSAQDPFYKLFFGNFDLRPSCYTCNRVKLSEADITIGDFWGVTKTKDIEDTDEGISLSVVHTQLGKKIFAEIKNTMVVKELSKESVQYCYKNRNIERKNDIDYNNFDFFNNDILPKPSLIKRIKTACMANGFMRFIIYKIKR